jgi:hypothetical protein
MIAERHPTIRCTPFTASILLVIFACFYAVELTSLPLSIDDELAAVGRRPEVWVGQGRWTTYLIELLFLPRPVLPFVPIAIFGLCLVFAYILLVKALGRNVNAPASLITFPLFAAFPTWSFITEFQANTPAIGIGVLACCFAIALLRPMLYGWRGPTGAALAMVANGALASLMIAIAAGAYQTLPLLLVVLGLAAIMFAAMDDPKGSVWTILQGVVLLAIVCAFGLSLYFLILSGFRAITGTGVMYIDNFIRMDVLLAQPAQVLGRCLLFAWNIYSGSSVIYVVTAWAFGIVLALSFVAISLTPQLRNRTAVRVLLILMHYAIVLIPFTMTPISGGEMPIRSLIGVPAVVWICAYLAITTPVVWLGRASFAVTAITVFQTLYSVYLYQSNSILVRQRDAATAAAIYHKIAEQQPEWDRSRTYPLLVYGAWPFVSTYERHWSSTAGASFFEWDGGNPARVVSFMKVLGYSNIEMAAEQRRKELLDVAREMPVWPAKGSVRTSGDFTIIKLGPIK